MKSSPSTAKPRRARIFGGAVSAYSARNAVGCATASSRLRRCIPWSASLLVSGESIATSLSSVLAVLAFDVDFIALIDDPDSNSASLLASEGSSSISMTSCSVDTISRGCAGAATRTPFAFAFIGGRTALAVCSLVRCFISAWI